MVLFTDLCRSWLSCALCKCVNTVLHIVFGTGGNVENKAVVASSGAIPALLVILGTCSVELQAQVAVILYNLVNNSPERQNAVAKSGAIPPLVSLLKSQNPSLLTEAGRQNPA